MKTLMKCSYKQVNILNMYLSTWNSTTCLNIYYKSIALFYKVHYILHFIVKIQYFVFIILYVI